MRRSELFDPPREGRGDYHAHVFPGDTCHVQDPWYVPNYDATVGDYLAALQEHGIAWGTLVQPSFLGTDNSFMLDVMQQYPDLFRGVVVVDHDDPMSAQCDLDVWNQIGVRGVRLNLYGLNLPDLQSDSWVQFTWELKRLGWFLQFYCKPEQLEALSPAIRELPCTIVIDHLGFPLDENLENHPLLDLIELENVWVKASGAYRSPAGLSKAMYQLLKSKGFERLVPGSDWPHTLHREDPVDAWYFFNGNENDR